MYKSVYKYDDMKRSEHMAVRDAVGWYFWTHEMLEVTGPDAAAFLDRVFPKPIASLAVGRERYTTMLDESGTIIDDVVVFRRDAETFWISTLFVSSMIVWFDAHREGMDVTCTDITGRYQMYAIQGPKSLEMVNRIVETPVDDLRFFSFCENRFEGIPVMVNRAGFTGEKYGYEIYVPTEEALHLEKVLRETASLFGGREVTEFQIMAWTLPTEAGFYYMRDLHRCNPFEVGLERGIDWDKEFIGKDALLRIRESGVEREMLGFTMEQADVHLNPRSVGGPGNPVVLDGEEIGRLVKFNYSYVREISIGYILVRKGLLKTGDSVYLAGNGYDDFYEAVIAEKPFI